MWCRICLTGFGGGGGGGGNYLDAVSTFPTHNTTTYQGTRNANNTTVSVWVVSAKRELTYMYVFFNIWDRLGMFLDRSAKSIHAVRAIER